MKSDIWVEKSQILPKFSRDRVVHFIGGCGKIKHCTPDAGTWVYAVEMDMGIPPETGRIGFETTILLHEADTIHAADIQAVL
jgi:hypothetical protein